MKKRFLCFSISLLLFFNISFAQNLVPNPSFEDTLACPNSLTEIDYAVGWSSYSVTPDYFNSCASPTAHPSLSVPSNQWGFQYARTGNAYAGLVTYYGTIPDEREYIGVQINQPLEIGQRYFASFYVSRALSPNPYINIATNKIGLKLSTVQFSSSNPAPINNFAHIYTDTIIEDTLNWIKIFGSFIADSSYQYLAIGNFFNDSLTSKIFYDTISSVAYYYIDDIYLSTTPEGNDIINELDKKKEVRIFPNPTHNWIIIESLLGGLISIYDLFGHLYYEDSFSSSSKKINLSDFKKGIYIIKINNAKENLTQRLIIQ